MQKNPTAPPGLFFCPQSWPLGPLEDLLPLLGRCGTDRGPRVPSSERRNHRSQIADPPPHRSQTEVLKKVVIIFGPGDLGRVGAQNGTHRILIYPLLVGILMVLFHWRRCLFH